VREKQLEGCRLKLGRAMFHTAAIVDAFAEFVSVNMSLSHDPDNAPDPRVPWRLHLDRNVPEEFGLLVGDAVQNTRSVLDYLVYELAVWKRGGSKPRQRTQFPISTDVSRYFETGRKQISSLDPRYRKVIRLLQPYQRDDPESHTLAILNRLSNADKHRLLHVTHSGLTNVAFALDGRGTKGVVLPQYGSTTDDLERAWADPNVGATALVDLMLKDGFLSVSETLRESINTAYAIVEWFEPVFAETP
jgi:hypothetical protein